MSNPFSDIVKIPKNEPCLRGCKIPVQFCCGEPKVCKVRYEKYLAKIAKLKAKHEAEEAERARKQAEATAQ